MATLTVWRFDTTDGAARAAVALDALVRSSEVVVHDAAVVEWETKERKPRTRQLSVPALSGALDAGFWGLLFGLVFYMPLLSAALGSAGGATGGTLGDIGVDDHFMNRVRDQVTPGTSALVTLSSEAAVDRVHAAIFDGPRSDLIRTDLDDAQETALREVFGR